MTVKWMFYSKQKLLLTLTTFVIGENYMLCFSDDSMFLFYVLKKKTYTKTIPVSSSHQKLNPRV